MNTQDTCPHLWYTDEAKKEHDKKWQASPDSPFQFTPAPPTALSVVVNDIRYDYDFCLLCTKLKPMEPLGDSALLNIKS